MKVQAYLTFSGDCQQAVDFYADCFNAEVVNRQTYQQSKMDIPGNYQNKLQHAEVKGKGVHFMAYDAAPDTPINSGNQIHMSVDLTDKDEAHAIFNSLSDGGQIITKMQEKEWGAIYGRLRDKYGIHWMVNCDVK